MPIIEVKIEECQNKFTDLCELEIRINKLRADDIPRNLLEPLVSFKQKINSLVHQGSESVFGFYDAMKIGKKNSTVMSGKKVQKGNVIVMMDNVKKDTMKIQTFLEHIDKYEFMPMKLYSGWQKVLLKLYNDDSMMGIIKKTDLPTDAHEIEMKDIPKKMISLIEKSLTYIDMSTDKAKKGIDDIVDDMSVDTFTVKFMVMILKSLISYGINQFAFVCVLYNYLNLVLKIMIGCKIDIEAVLYKIDYIKYAVEQINSKGLDDFVNNEKKIHNYKFVDHDSARDIFKCISLLLQIDENIKKFNDTLLKDNFDFDEFMTTLYKNKLFTAIVLKYNITEHKLKYLLLPNFVLINFNIKENWQSYFMSQLLIKGLSTKYFTFDHIMMTNKLQYIKEWINDGNTIPFNVDHIIKFTLLIQYDGKNIINSFPNLFKSSDLIDMFDELIRNIKIDENVTAEKLFTLHDYFINHKMKIFAGMVKTMIGEYYNEKIKIGNIDIFHIYDFVRALWYTFPYDQLMYIINFADVDPGTPRFPTNSEIGECVKKMDNRTVKINRIGNKFLNIEIDIEKLENRMFDAEGLLLPYLDKAGYNIENVNCFLRFMSIYYQMKN